MPIRTEDRPDSLTPVPAPDPDPEPEPLTPDPDPVALQAIAPPAPEPTVAPAPPVPAMTIGDPGRAFTEVESLLPAGTWNQPDTEVDGFRAGDLEVRAASVRGLSHRQGGTPRQDAYGLAVDAAGRWLVVAVADGVSAGPRSHEAARLVTRRGPREIVSQLDGGLAHPAELDWRALFNTLGSLILVAGRRGLQPGPDEAAEDDAVVRAMATTATFAVIELDTGCAHREVVVAWLGDSPVWTVSRDESWRCLSAIKGAGADLASSVVAALPRLPTDALPVHRATVASDDVLLVMTDGVGDPLDDGRGEVGRTLARWWREPPQPLDFAAQVGFGRKSFDDDRTAVGIWPRTGTSG